MRTSSLSPLDKEIILSHVLKKPREYLFAHPEKTLSDNQISRFSCLARRRLSNEPLAYITNGKEFYGLDFFVDENVLIPRPETELLAHIAIKYILKNSNEKLENIIVDAGTGSGNIIIAMAKNIPKALFKKNILYGFDFSNEALEIAKKNAARHSVEGKIRFVKSNFLNYFLENKKSLENKNLFIVANLPYVSPVIFKKYFAELRYEPRAALLSRRRGMWHYQNFFKQVKKVLSSCHPQNICIFLEISPEQKKLFIRLIKPLFPSGYSFHKDLAGKWRALEIFFSAKDIQLHREDGNKKPALPLASIPARNKK